MYTKKDVLQIAKEQLAMDFNCQVSDFHKERNTIVENKLVDGRRVYDSDGCFFKILCYGDKAIINASPDIIPWCEEKLLNREAAWLFEYPKLRAIDNKLQEFGQEIVDIHQFYLPDCNGGCKEAKFNIRWYDAEDILQFKNDERFSEAFAFDENRADILGVAAYDGENIMGMAGASEDIETMWQIGIDVLPGYRGRGVGTSLVALLKDEILKRGKVPFYSTVQSHIHSQNIAMNSGFFPAWVELYSGAKK